MKRTTKTENNVGLQVLGVFLFLLAVPMVLMFPIGTVLGILLMVGACTIGHKKQKVWACPGCGYFFERV